jgi:preprotein translocase subunit SecG
MGYAERLVDLNALMYVLVALDAILGVSVLVLIFLHSGKDAGLSSMFGGGGSIGGSGVVQKNLDRLTVGCAVAFIIVTIALVYLV